MKQILLLLLLAQPLISLGYAGEEPNLSTKAGFQAFYQQTIMADQYKVFYKKGPLAEAADYPGVPPVRGHSITEFFSNEELLEALNEKPIMVGAFMPWHYFQYPDLRIRMEGYEDRINYPSFRSEMAELSSGMEKRRTFLLDSKREPGLGLTDHQREIPTPTLSTYIEHGKNADLIESKAAKIAACARLAGIHFQKCVQALDKILEFMAPKDSIAALPLLAQIMGDESYAEGTVHAAVKMMDAIAEFKKTGTYPTSANDLFDDMVTAFIEKGDAREIAIQKTWDLLGLFSTRGVNLHLLFPYAASTAAQRTIVALETLMMGAAVLDSARAGTGTLYSLPKTVTTVADYGKTYHFWMSAYLTRKGVLEGYGSGASSAAALSEIGYQMFSTTADREKLFATIMKEKRPKMATRKTQIDLAFGLAGAEFGRLAGENKITKDSLIDIDYALKRMVEGGMPQSWANYEKKIGKKYKPVQYLAWLDQVHPITGFNAIRGRTCLGLFKRPSQNTSYVSTLPTK